jgi:peptidyl-prolyl cis-trans isomerase C
MNRKLTTAALALALLAACKSGEKPDAKKTGPVVAKGEGVTITADELKARIDEQSPFVRSRFAALDKKKEFLDNLVRFELLAREAEKQGLANDPDVQLMTKRMMVQKLVQKSFAEGGDPASAVSEADAKAYYDGHPEEFHRPAKVRVAQIVLKSPESAPARAKKEAEARALVAKIRAEEKNAPGAFMVAARDASQDEATKASGGDLGFRTKEELAAQLSPAAADAALALKDGEISNVLATPQGLVLLKRTGWQDAVDRPFDAVKAQIQAKLQRERRTKDFDELVKRLKDQAKVTIDEKELEKVEVAAGSPAPPGGIGGALPPGMGGPPAGGGGGMPPGMGGPPGGRPGGMMPPGHPVRSGAPGPGQTAAPAPAAR